MKRSGWLLLLLSILIHGTIQAQSEAQLPDLTGTIAYIGEDQNVYTLQFPDNQAKALTTDASNNRLYRWPTWSTDGRLAYFTLVRRGSILATEAYVTADEQEAGQRIYTAEDEFLNYAFWSPQNCAPASECRDLALLLNSSAQPSLFVRLIRTPDSQAVDGVIGEGRPFYFSWSPDGSRMLWQRNNRSLDIFDVTVGGIVETLEFTPGRFQAPAWSPIDDRLLFGVLNNDAETTDLVILANNSVRTIATALRGRVAFAWSPDGNYVAYADRDGPLRIVDSNTGELISRSASGGIAAFFWSPNSEHVAFLTPALPPNSFSVQSNNDVRMAAYIQDAMGVAWSVIDVETGTTRRFGAFLPTQEMLYFLVYFDQFAQSHRLWSPDSRYLVYAEISADGGSMISLLDTLRVDVVPVSLTDGLIAVWSFE